MYEGRMAKMHVQQLMVMLDVWIGVTVYVQWRSAWSCHCHYCHYCHLSSMSGVGQFGDVEDWQLYEWSRQMREKESCAREWMVVALVRMAETTVGRFGAACVECPSSKSIRLVAH